MYNHHKCSKCTHRGQHKQPVCNLLTFKHSAWFPHWLENLGNEKTFSSKGSQGILNRLENEGILPKILEKWGNISPFSFFLWFLYRTGFVKLIKLNTENILENGKLLEKSGKIVSPKMWEPCFRLIQFHFNTLVGLPLFLVLKSFVYCRFWAIWSSYERAAYDECEHVCKSLCWCTTLVTESSSRTRFLSSTTSTQVQSETWH